MFLRGLGYQNDGDSLAGRKEKERERTSPFPSCFISLCFSFCLLPFRCRALYPTPPMACHSVLFRVFLALNWCLFSSLSISFWILSLFSCTFRSSSSLRPQKFRLSISPISLRDSKVRFIFYYSLCLPDMFGVILRLCDPLRSYHGSTWNLFRKFDVLDIVPSVKKKHCARGYWHDSSFVWKESPKYYSGLFVYSLRYTEILCGIT